MRKALIIGIDHYEYLPELHGCVNDAISLKRLLDRHADGTINFAQPKVILSQENGKTITRSKLKQAVRELFEDNVEVALFYFAGHGFVETTGGYLCAGDCKSGDDGLALSDIMIFANKSPARNKIVILDSCYSGKIGENANSQMVSEISEGVTILTSCTKDQYASEMNGGGVFTSLVIDALSGAAADLVGQITPGSIYAHVDQSLGSWSQRPVFKTNVKSFVSLRQVDPPIPRTDLRKIADLFPVPGYEYPLDPSYEPEHDDAITAHTEIFAILQRYNRVNLLVPVGAPHMYHAAVERKAAKLTPTGEHYRRLVVEGLI